MRDRNVQREQFRVVSDNSAAANVTVRVYAPGLGSILARYRRAIFKPSRVEMLTHPSLYFISTVDLMLEKLANELSAVEGMPAPYDDDPILSEIVLIKGFIDDEIERVPRALIEESVQISHWVGIADRISDDLILDFAENLYIEKLVNIGYNSDVSSSAEVSSSDLIKMVLEAQGVPTSDFERVAKAVQATIDRERSRSPEPAAPQQAAFVPNRLYRGKAVDGDPVAFLKEVWRDPFAAGGLTQATVRAGDPKLFKAITNLLGPRTADVLTPATRGPRRKPAPGTPEEAALELQVLRARSRERAATSRLQRQKR